MILADTILDRLVGDAVFRVGYVYQGQYHSFCVVVGIVGNRASGNLVSSASGIRPEAGPEGVGRLGGVTPTTLVACMLFRLLQLLLALQNCT